MQYYVLKERAQDYDPVVGVVNHASAALATSTLCANPCVCCQWVELFVTSKGPTGIFEVLTLNRPVFTFGGEQNLACDSPNSCGGLRVNVHGFFSCKV